MRKVLSAALLGLILLAPTAFARRGTVDFSTVPAQFRDYLYYDINFNAPGRKGGVFKGDPAGTIRRLSHFENVEYWTQPPFVSSRNPYTFSWANNLNFLNNPDLANIFYRDVGAAKALQFFVFNRAQDFQLGLMNGVLPLANLQETHSMMKVLSQNTYFVWGDDPESQAFFIKRAWGYDQGPVVSQMLNEMSSAWSDFPLAYFPEYGSFTIQLSLGPKLDFLKSQSYLIRPFKVKGRSHKPRVKLYPLHAVMDLDSGLMDRAAQAAKMSREDWIVKIYLPALAKFTATNHFRLGLHHASHTQNLVAAIDPVTGQIEFVVRDLRDAVFDFFTMEQRSPKLFERAKSFRGKVDQLGHTNYEESLKWSGQKISPGGYFEAYGSQSILELAQETIDRVRNFDIFLGLYIKEAERITRIPLMSNPKLQELLEKLKSGLNGEKIQHLVNMAGGPSGQLRGLEALVYDIIEVTATTVRSGYLEKILSEYPVQVGEPGEYHQAFWQNPRDQHSYLLKNTFDRIYTFDRENLVFERRGPYVIARTRDTGEPLAITRVYLGCDDVLN